MFTQKMVKFGNKKKFTTCLNGFNFLSNEIFNKFLIETLMISLATRVNVTKLLWFDKKSGIVHILYDARNGNSYPPCDHFYVLMLG